MPHERDRELGRHITSSIEAVWPAEVCSNNRVRGFYPTTVSSEDEVIEFLRHFKRCRLTAQDLQISRVTLRLLGRADVVYRLIAAGISVEGALPLARPSNFLIIYTAWNEQTRTISDDDRLRHLSLLTDSALLQPHNPSKDDHRRLVDFNADVLLAGRNSTSLTESIKEQFFSLYRTFGLVDNEVLQMLDSPNNSIAYLLNSVGSIVCTAIAESARITIEGHRELLIYEITDAITRPDYRGRGLYRILSAHLIDRVIESTPQPIDLIYGESNLSSPGVIYAARKNGRRFVFDDAAFYENVTNGFGILIQNYRVDDGIETRPYNDFALSYVLI